MAWGTEGHRIAGFIAESYLSPKAKAAIKAILGDNGIAIASNWADFIRSDPNYSYLAAWHYIDLDKAYSYPQLQVYLKQDTQVDAYTKLNFLIAELKKNIKVTWNGNPGNLHSVWDSGLIEFQQLSYTEYAKSINFTTAAQRAQWQKEPISQWLFESNQVADKLYDETKSGDTLKGYKYNFNHIATVNRQLLKAGVRLAGVLNAIFG
jgi:hypothetical protein